MATYSYLKTDIINTAENDSTEFADQIPAFVNRAEDRLIKELDDSGLDYYTSVTLTANNPNVTLPSGALVVRNVCIEQVYLLILQHYYKDLTNMQ